MLTIVLSFAKDLVHIFKLYQSASGQLINQNSFLATTKKSQILTGVDSIISSLWRWSRVVLNNLVYPQTMGRSKKATFSFIQDRIWRKKTQMLEGKKLVRCEMEYSYQTIWWVFFFYLKVFVKSWSFITAISIGEANQPSTKFIGRVGILFSKEKHLVNSVLRLWELLMKPL